MGALSDHQIENLSLIYSKNPPLIEPYRREQLTPASYDVRLAEIIHVPMASGKANDLRKPISQLTRVVNITEDGWVLEKDGFILGSTVERVGIPNWLVARIEGKSSLARLGLQIHSAGFLDPGFEGNITLEITNFGPDPIRLWPDVLIGQLCFEGLLSQCREPYKGRYQGSTGVVTSRYNHEIEPNLEVA